MGAYFGYASRSKLSINDLTCALEGAQADDGPNCAEVLRWPVLPVPGLGEPIQAQGASPR